MSDVCESTRKEIDVVKEIEGYGQHQHIFTVNRDGDLYYIECPECHSTALTSKRLLGCKSCHTRFSLYFEDGFRSLSVITNSGTVSGSNGKIKLLELKPKAYFKSQLLGRNDNPKAMSDLKKKYPDLKVIILNKDLQKDGKDAHGHQQYKRYALIPLD